ncbi:MAG TPA: hypothetical protein VL593_01635 [Ramlibacter sp.]|nr:hypothetical protein [Ramlibacter sp.]
MTSPTRSEAPMPASVRRTAERKPYTPPKIEEYGTIPALTRNVSAAGKAKDGGSNNIKT